jgi:hypothetical protein
MIFERLPLGVIAAPMISALKGPGRPSWLKLLLHQSRSIYNFAT